MNANTRTAADAPDNSADAPVKTTPVKTAAAKTARTLRGNVIKAGADKTITVLIERKLKHPLYKKYIRRSTKVHAHDEKNECRPGDAVVIESCRPLSKLKCWRLVAIVRKAA